MDRRNFLRSMLGVAAATALPSEVFPFRKIFLPAAPRIVALNLLDIPAIEAIEAIELEVFAKQIPELFYRQDSLYELFKRRESIATKTARINYIDSGSFIWTPNEDQAKAIAEKQAQGIDVQAAIDVL